VPDTDVADPDRIRARSFAVEYDLPVDSGVVLRELAPCPRFESADRLVLRSDEVVETELSRAAASSAVDGTAAAHLPRSSAPKVHGEAEFGLDVLLVNLREDAPPPPPPATLVTRRPRYTDLVLDADHLVEAVSTVGDDGDLVIHNAGSATLQWKPPTVDDATLAEVELSNVRVMIERRNEAVLVTAKSLGTMKSDRWIAVADNGPADLQLDWFEVLLDAGMPGGRMGQRVDEPTEMGGRFPAPTECRLANRSIEPIVEIVDVDAGTPLRSADESLLPPVQQFSHSRTPTAPLPDELGRTLLARSDRSFTKMALSGFDVRESWAGHGTAVHQYQAFDGLPVLPQLTDVDARAEDFGVCRDGHFYSVATAGRCQSCDTWACRACDEAEHQATTSCGTCASNVCRRCLSTERTVSPATCFSCGRKECAECGRDPQVVACAICARDACGDCRETTTCTTCASLLPASDELLASAPAELALVGCHVLTASDADATTMLIKRGRAVEHAVIRGGAVVRWVAFERAHVTPLYALRITASASLGRLVSPIERSAEAEHPVAYPHLVIAKERSFVGEWSIPDSEASGRGTLLFTHAMGDLIQAVLDIFPKPIRLPEPFAGMPAEVRRAAATIAEPAADYLELRWRAVGHDTVLAGTGLVVREVDGPAVIETPIDWTDDGSDQPWISAGWQPAPAVRASAETSNATAVVVKMASMLTVGVRTDNTTSWYSVVASPHAAAATALARRAGLADADEVAVYTDPSRIRRSRVLNAADASLTVEPVIEHTVVSTTSAGFNVTYEALSAWYQEARILLPNVGVLPNELRLNIVRALDHRPDRTTLRIGAMVEEVMRTDTGQVWPFDVLLNPGDQDARRFDSKSMQHRDQGVLDREGHFGDEDARCGYCNGRVCGLCTKGMTACDCCGIALCMLCVREPHQNLWLCPACAGVRPPSRAEARQHGRLMFTRGMLIGSDDKHVVVVEQSKKTWIRHGEGDDEKHPLASPSLAGFLNERLSMKAAD
jgi:hypothetical protein